MRARTWPAWVGALVCLLTAVISTVCILASGQPFSLQTLADRAFPLITVAGLITGLMGSLVLSRRPRHPIGRLLIAAGVITSVSLACDAYAVWAESDGNFEPVAKGVAWLASALNANLTLACFTMILLLAPDGTLASPRWRTAVVITVLGAGLMELPPFLEPASFASTDPGAQRATTVYPWLAGSLILLGALVVALVSVVRRELRSAGRQRAQIRWFSTAAGTLVGCFGWYVLIRNTLPGDGAYALSVLPLFIAVLFFPVAIAIAVLGYRLYDIDVIVNRAWLLLGATVFVGVVYIGSVTFVSAAVPDLWASALVAAAVACVFQPLRLQLVRLADRIAYGDQAFPYLALADLSRRLGRTPDPERLLASVAQACSQATGAVAARVDLTGADGTLLASTTAPDGVELDENAAVRLEVRYWGETLGALWVQPALGRALRRRDLLVLSGFSEQAGVAFRNLRLGDELGEKVAELSGVAARLTESRDRIVRARADELSALRRSLSRQVAPRLAAVARSLDGLVNETSSADPAWAEAESEIAAATAELRTLSHGLYPALLEAEGLGPALRSLLRRRSAATVIIGAAAVGRRFERRLESAVYACVVWTLDAGRSLRGVVVDLDSDRLLLRMSVPQPEISHRLRDLVEGCGGEICCTPTEVTVRLDAAPAAGAAQAVDRPVVR